MTAASYCGIWKKPSTHESNQFSWKENITPISFAWLSTVAIRRCSLEVRKSSLIHWSLSCDCLRVEAMSEILPHMKGLFNNPLYTWKLTLISTWRFFWNREFFSKHNIFSLIMLLFFPNPGVRAVCHKLSWESSVQSCPYLCYRLWNIICVVPS